MVSGHNSEFLWCMKQVLTLVVKLQASTEQQQLLNDTASAFASACNWINQNVNPRITNKNSIQAVCYQDVKQQFGLTANHVVRDCARVAANRLFFSRNHLYDKDAVSSRFLFNRFKKQNIFLF